MLRSKVFALQGDYIWVEPISRREFDVAIGARVISAEGRKIQVSLSVRQSVITRLNRAFLFRFLFP